MTRVDANEVIASRLLYATDATGSPTTSFTDLYLNIQYLTKLTFGNRAGGG